MSELINTGKMIQRHIHERIIRRTDLAKQMGVPHSAIYSYEKRSSISSHILLRICHATRHNFFADIARALPSDYTIAKGSPTDHVSTLNLDAVIAQQAEEIKQLRIENNLLKELLKKG